MLPNINQFDWPTGVPVSNEGGYAGGYTLPAVRNAENAVPVHGQININTASWRVQTAINWTPYPAHDARRDEVSFVGEQITGDFEFAAGPDGIDDNIQIAKAMTWWRDGIRGVAGSGQPQGPGGPFLSIFDVYRVRAIRTYYNIIGNVTDMDDADGDFSPSNATLQPGEPFTDDVRRDFEEKFQLINRIGNLITTRSDSFTVYIVVQGWRGVGASNPEKVVERRAAFIADRSGVTATGGQLKITNVASE
jgi:hypothetical protein